VAEAISLHLSNLQAWYGDSQALFGVGFAVRRGEVTCLVGRNGAGKTTTLRAIMGLSSRQSGSILLSGRDATGMRPYERVRLGIGYCPEERAIFSSLTVEENLALPPAVAAAGMAKADIFAMFPNLRARARHYGNQLSGGEQQMLAIARILRTGAQTLLLDEPTEGLAPVIVRQIEDALIELKRRGYTILLVEQNLDFVLHLADRVVAIDNGIVVDDIETRGGEQVKVRLLERLAL
jgi:branched-chain amino acid transport system ATP-binding protein